MPFIFNLLAPRAPTQLSDMNLFSRYDTVLCPSFFAAISRTHQGRDLGHTPGRLIVVDWVAYSLRRTRSRPVNPSKKKLSYDRK